MEHSDHRAAAAGPPDPGAPPGGVADPLPLVTAALRFASRHHAGQTRKDGATPYINHPAELADTLCNLGGVRDPVVIAAALLHDTVEDTAAELADIERLFGPEVAAVVAAVTDDKTLPKAERKRRQVEGAAGSGRRAQLVKLADKICNCRDVAERPPAQWSAERCLAYLDWSESVVAGLRGVNPVLEAEFDRVVAEGRRRYLGPASEG